MSFKLRTNYIPRPIIQGYELSESEKKEFDYLKLNELEDSNFFRYRGEVYYLGNFERYNCEHGAIMWHGSQADSAWTGILVHLCTDGESVIVASASW